MLKPLEPVDPSAGAALSSAEMLNAAEMREQERATSPLPGAWSSPLNAFRDDAYGSYAVCLCPCIVLPQLFVRTITPSEWTGSAWSGSLFGLLAIGLCLGYTVFGVLLLWCIGQLFGRMGWAAAFDAWWVIGDWPRTYNSAQLAAQTGVVLTGLALMTVTTYLLVVVRGRLRARDDIPGTQQHDCLVSCCCCTQPCVTCQIMRHEGLVKGSYQVFSSDGTVPINILSV